jgi:general secretion pathway protein I
MTHPARGFTLIEVLIALLVIALGVGALLATLTSSADTVARLREKSLAEWIALNRISEVRLSNSRPVPGVTTGTLEKFADESWTWRQSVTDPGIAGILRVEVQVARRGAAGTAVTETATPASSGSAATDAGAARFPALATAYGFLGTAVAPATGVDPDWSIAAAGAGGGPGTGGAPGTGGGGGATPGGANPGGGNGAPQR